MLLEPFLRNVRSTPDRVAVIDDSGSYTNQRLGEMAMGLGALMRLKTQRPTVGILLPASAGFIASFYGALLAGKVPVPINFLLGPREVGHVIADSGIDTVLTIPQLGERLKDTGVNAIDLTQLATQSLPPQALQYSPPTYEADDLATILYTSGTSGLPKGVCLSHGNLRRDIVSAIAHVGLNQDHKFLGIVPLFHSTGVVAAMLAPIELNATVVHIARFSPVATIKAIREHKISIMAGVPSMYGALLKLKDASAADFASMFAALSGGEPLPSTIRNAFAERFGTHLYEGYGLTETIGITCLNAPGKHKPGSVGRPISVAEVLIVDDNDAPVPQGATGEVLIRGVHVMKGYHNLPEETARVMTESGYLRTGDLGHFDEEGFLFITGRKKDLIIVSGEKVYPREIEELLGTHASIADVAVVGRPCDVRGEAVVAFVVPREGHTFDVDAAREHLKSSGTVNWKLPKEVHSVTELPRTPTGKVLKRELVTRAIAALV